MSCQHEGSTHFACDCVLKQLEAADALAKAAAKAHEDYVCWTHGCPSDGHGPCDHNPKYSQPKLAEALAAYEKVRRVK